MIAPLEILRLNSRLLRNCLQGMTDEQSLGRPDDRANSAIWVAVHMTRSRYGLLKRLGVELANPLPPHVIAAKSIDEVTEWPPVADVVSAWNAAARALESRISAVTAAELDAPVDVKFPVHEQTNFGALVFLTQHDAYHLGQLSLLRKQAGLPAMSYAAN
ncbi:MAG TPA: DinB family protein [Gemmatimonadaceae bacterium]